MEIENVTDEKIKIIEFWNRLYNDDMSIPQKIYLNTLPQLPITKDFVSY